MAIVREVQLDDLPGVAALTHSVGWGEPTAANWRRLWIENPALQGGAIPISRGWVIEDHQRVVGFLCNLAQLYDFRGTCLRAAIAACFVVAPEFRGQSLQLMMAFARQTGVDLLLNTTASPQVSKILEFMKFTRIPQPDYDRSFYWILRCRSFLNSAFRKKGYPPVIGRVAGAILSPLLWAHIRFSDRGPPLAENGLTLRIRSAEEIDDDFDDLWRRRLSHSRQLLAYRDAPTLRWHFATDGKQRAAKLICAYERDRLVGYLALARQDAPHLALPRARIVDLFVEIDDLAFARQLLVAAAREARRDGAAMIEAIGFPEAYQRMFEEYRPFELYDESWPFLYKAIRPELHRELASADGWHACLYDGDGGL